MASSQDTTWKLSFIKDAARALKLIARSQPELVPHIEEGVEVIRLNPYGLGLPGLTIRHLKGMPPEPRGRHCLRSVVAGFTAP